jgi:hypothetical protein
VDSLVDQIRDALYRERRLLAGDMLDALVLWGYAIARSGGSVLFITSNYDAYLQEALESIADQSDVRLTKMRVLNATGPTGQLPRTWRNPGNMSLLHVHGYIPEDAEPLGIPAFGEITYQETSGKARKVMSEAMTGSNVVTVGSSLSDAPLVESLIASKKSATGLKRYAILPLQGAEWRDDEKEKGRDESLFSLNRQRLNALGLQGVYPDYYGQVPQVFYEAAEWLSAGAGRPEPGRLDHRQLYKNRLDEWWSHWDSRDSHDAIRYHSALLRHILPGVRGNLGAGSQEGIKLEIWARSDPNGEGRLGLWCSTSGSHEPEFAHRDSISLKSPYVSVKTFCLGSPQFFEQYGKSRWSNYFAFPIWNWSQRGAFIVGVAVIASMPAKDDPEGGSVRMANIHRVVLAAERLASVADKVLNHKIDSNVSRAYNERIAIDNALGADSSDDLPILE